MARYAIRRAGLDSSCDYRFCCCCWQVLSCYSDARPARRLPPVRFRPRRPAPTTEGYRSDERPVKQRVRFCSRWTRLMTRAAPTINVCGGRPGGRSGPDIGRTGMANGCSRRPPTIGHLLRPTRQRRFASCHMGIRQCRQIPLLKEPSRQTRSRQRSCFPKRHPMRRSDFNDMRLCPDNCVIAPSRRFETTGAGDRRPCPSDSARRDAQLREAATR